MDEVVYIVTCYYGFADTTIDCNKSNYDSNSDSQKILKFQGLSLIQKQAKQKFPNLQLAAY